MRLKLNQNIKLILALSESSLREVSRCLEDPSVDPSTGDNLAIRWASEHGH